MSLYRVVFALVLALLCLFPAIGCYDTMRPGADGTVGVDFSGVFQLEFDVPSQEIRATNYTDERVKINVYRRTGGGWYRIADFRLSSYRDNTDDVRGLAYGQRLQIEYKVGRDKDWSYSYIELGYP